MVQDFSYPRNDPVLASVNDAIDSDKFLTEWGTFDRMSELILSVPCDAQAAAFDITAAYRITPIAPAEQHMLCVSWRGKIYLDFAASFGMRSSCGIFGSIADMLLAIYRGSGFQLTLKWVDDFITIRLRNDTRTEADFIALTAALGVPWSIKKTKAFASTQRYIGFDWNLADKTVAMPVEKLARTIELTQAWLVPLASFGATEAARLHGKLAHISSIYPLIRPFLRSIARFASHFTSTRARLHPPGPLTRDLSWVLSLIRKLPNKLPLTRDGPVDLQWWGDASTSFGIGVCIGSFYGVWPWAPGFIVGPRRSHDIGWAEAVAVDLGLCMAMHHGLLINLPRDRACLLVRSDNTGVVAVVNKGRSRNENTNEVLKHIYTNLASLRLRLVATFIPSRENITDALSRGDVPSFLHGFPSAATPSSLPLPAYLTGKLMSP